MERPSSRCLRFLAMFTLVGAALLPGLGCTSVLTTAAYLIKGTDVDAEYKGLKEKKVVVVCRPLASLTYRDSNVARDMARQLSILLRTNVPKIEVIEQSKVVAWTDEHEWTEFPEVGEALEADTVVGIDLLGFSIYQGQTLYQGKANVNVKVYDLVEGEKVVFEKELPQAVYPPSGGVETASYPEAEFRRKFVRIVADQVGRHFYKHDRHADFALDATALDK